jgi:replication-associated recombination protein RarA
MATENEKQMELIPDVEEEAEKDPYQKDEVVSSWIKALRLGETEDAMYWTMVMLKKLKLGQAYVMRRLAIFAFEDAMDPDFAQYVSAGLACCHVTKTRYASGGNGNISYVLVEAACRAVKFWELPEGRERERVWGKVEDDFADGKVKEIPTYGKDKHTRSGRALGTEGDNRFSGDNPGRENMCVRFEKYDSLRTDLPGMFTWSDEDD